jgi:hypothetical protein
MCMEVVIAWFKVGLLSQDYQGATGKDYRHPQGGQTASRMHINTRFSSRLHEVGSATF